MYKLSVKITFLIFFIGGQEGVLKHGPIQVRYVLPYNLLAIENALNLTFCFFSQEVKVKDLHCTVKTKLNYKNLYKINKITR